MAGAILASSTKGELHIQRAPQHQRVTAGSTVSFRCTAGTGTLLYGIPAIEWRKDDIRINFQANPRYAHNELDNSLTIHNVSTADTGLYMCVAQLADEMDRASAELIVEDVPSAPVDVELAYCDGRLAQIQWKLINENYSPVTQFIIQYNTSFEPDTWHVAKTQLPRNRNYQRIALSPWGNYSFRVIAENAVGLSQPSAQTDRVCRMPPDVPHHNPRNLCTRNHQPHILFITWDVMPILEHNAPGFYYLLKWRRHDPDNERDFEEVILEKSVGEYVISNQPIYKSYDIYVLAVNQVGEAVSPPKMHRGHSGEDVPLEYPMNFRLDQEKVVTASTVDFLWDSVNQGAWRMQGFFKGYKIQFWKTDIGQSSLREHSIIYREPEDCWSEPYSRKKWEISSGHVYNLWPYTNITAQIVAMNTKYDGPPSNKVYFTTQEGVPGPVARLGVTRKGSTHLELRWAPPQVTNGVLVGFSIAYDVVSQQNDFHPHEEFDINDPLLRSLKLQGLRPDSTYRISLWARSRVGRGEPYGIDESTMVEGPPVAPNFTTVNISKRAVNVTWMPSASGNPGSVFSVNYRRLGQLYWIQSPEESDRNWEVIDNLVPGVVYEMRVVARNSHADDSLENSSPVQRVQLGMRREIMQPTFRIVYLDKTRYGVGLTTYHKPVDSFFVQYKPAGRRQWTTTDDLPKEGWAILKDLLPGHAYHVRVTTNSEQGSSVSEIQEIMAGSNPDAQATKSNDGVMQTRSSCCVHPLPAVVLTILMCCLAAMHGTL